jgi:peptide deformylase
MQIVPYPHPALAFRSVEVKRIDATLRKTIAAMFELMYEADGIGLAANQVGLPLRFFLVNLAARADEPDEELVFINPVITKRRGTTIGEEGCLSIPGLYGDVRRSEALVVEAFDLEGQAFRLEVDDLPARVVQHESDHLDGIMFTDRMRDEGTSAKMDIELPKFATAYQQAQKAGEIQPDPQILEDLKAIAASGLVPEDYLARRPFKIELPKIKK